MNVAMVCFPGLGGSGIVGTELGLLLARAGHQVHYVCAERPRRLPEGWPNTTFHPVIAPAHPLAAGGYPLVLATALAEVVRQESIDVIHAHYAVPHAVSGWMARELVGGGVRLVTTLHGTDVTELAVDGALRGLLRHVVAASDAVSTPSAFLRDAALAALGLERPIEVIPNFVDPVVFERSHHGDALRKDLGGGRKVLMHISNFRPVKRVRDVVRVFAKVRERVPSVLVMVGDGPERGAAEEEARSLGVSADVRFLGKIDVVAPLLASADLYVFPSESESFGLSALEALASGVPVIGARVG
ncbi:MAG: N-acetyl-alpha-D-glucosaminyl L-malate synthase BshA, partial [Myxococcota bacterium]